MKTIEERAIEFADRHEEAELNLRGLGGVYGYDRIKNAEICAYERGATEQKEIDEEVRLKKCDDMTEAEYKREEAFALWYAKQGKGTPTFSDAIEWAREDAIKEAYEWLKARNVLTDASLEGFIQALEW